MHFPKSVIRGIEDGFCGCDTLESLTVAEDNPVYYGRDNCIIRRKGKRLVRGCAGSVIPTDGSVRAIGKNAFRDCGFERIVLPRGIEKIDDFAFSGCDKLTEIVLPDSLKSIGDYAFMFCGALGALNLPHRLKSIGEQAFGFCKNLAHITLPASLEEIGECAFDVQSVTFEDSEGWFSDSDHIPPEKLEEAIKDGIPLRKHAK